MMRPHILDMTSDSLAAWLVERGQPRFRVTQILDWVCKRYMESVDAMTDVPAALRRQLADAFDFSSPREAVRLVSANGLTGKLLLELGDGERIECVWMDDRGRLTFCISSQAGCPLGCRFCATGGGGFTRNLTAAEILGQVTALARAAGAPRNVVFMGMGEPLLNLEAVLAALDALADPARFALNARRLTVSTAGVTPGIRALAESPARPNLALSLNSPFDVERGELMPVALTHPLDEVIEACAEYADATGRRVMIEYVLLGGVNTSGAHAAATARVARRLDATVNLIPFNTVEGCGFRPPAKEEAAGFRAALERDGVAVVQRFRRGRDIGAACGQLRGGHAKGDSEAHG